MAGVNIGADTMHTDATKVSSVVVEVVRKRDMAISLLFTSAVTVDAQGIVNDDG